MDDQKNKPLTRKVFASKRERRVRKRKDEPNKALERNLLSTPADGKRGIGGVSRGDWRGKFPRETAEPVAKEVLFLARQATRDAGEARRETAKPEGLR